jgi:hypothetical protein
VIISLVFRRYLVSCKSGYWLSQMKLSVIMLSPLHEFRKVPWNRHVSPAHPFQIHQKRMQFYLIQWQTIFQLVKSCQITYEWPSLSSVLASKRLTVRPFIPSLFPPTPSPLIVMFVSSIFILHFSYFISSNFSSVTFLVPLFCHSFPLEAYPTKQSLSEPLVPLGIYPYKTSCIRATGS